MKRLRIFSGKNSGDMKKFRIFSGKNSRNMEKSPISIGAEYMIVPRTRIPPIILYPTISVILNKSGFIMDKGGAILRKIRLPKFLPLKFLIKSGDFASRLDKEALATLEIGIAPYWKYVFNNVSRVSQTVTGTIAGCQAGFTFLDFLSATNPISKNLYLIGTVSSLSSSCCIWYCYNTMAVCPPLAISAGAFGYMCKRIGKYAVETADFLNPTPKMGTILLRKLVKLQEITDLTEHY